MKNYDYYSRWAHSAIKEYVQEYYELMKTAKAAVKVTTVPAAVLPAGVSTQTNAQPVGACYSAAAAQRLLE